ncbi:MAG: iron chelate uptake ABC transporter family permease subunit [Paracoccus sp. (in: a-proteobacteria)]|nr:iron chelate uptake ABC transporter family permease subunit [Paracoccus sp. (in: a-proteobacteria)]
MRIDRLSRPHLVLLILALLAGISILAYMTLGARGNWGFVLPFRGRKLWGLILVAYSIALATVLFQTVTNNRILTPSIMGFDALYILVQTALVHFLGVSALVILDVNARFAMEVVLMLGFSGLLFWWLFVGEERSLHLLVLVGIVFGVLFRSLAQFMQRIMDPNAFQVLQDTFFASFQTVQPQLLGVSTAILVVATVILWRMGHSFDVLTLGRASAISLGVPYRRNVLIILITVAVLVSVSTALVGPVSFFGLLVVSLAHGLIGNSRHRYILPATVLLAVICLVGGQTLLERVFSFNTALSIIVEFLGGLVFIYLVLKGAAR